MSPETINLLRGLVTVVSFVGFVALVWHSWSRKRSSEHAEAAALPFQEDFEPRGDLKVAAPQGGQKNSGAALRSFRSQP